MLSLTCFVNLIFVRNYIIEASSLDDLDGHTVIGKVFS